MSELVIVEMNGENRIDSRLVAKSLGIKHPNFIATIRKYQDRLENFGSVLFETGPKERGKRGGDAPILTMLNEDQAIFIATLSRNTDQVVDFKLALTKAFSDARKKMQAQNQQIYINPDFVLRLKLNKGRVPYDHWTVLEQLDKESYHNGLDLIRLINKSRPDISVGLKWSNYLKKSGYDTSKFMTVPNIVHPGIMLEAEVKAYPLDLLPMFLRWFHAEYKEYFVKCYLPPRELKKQLA